MVCSFTGCLFDYLQSNDFVSPHDINTVASGKKMRPRADKRLSIGKSFCWLYRPSFVTDANNSVICGSKQCISNRSFSSNRPEPRTVTFIGLDAGQNRPVSVNKNTPVY